MSSPFKKIISKTKPSSNKYGKNSKANNLKEKKNSKPKTKNDFKDNVDIKIKELSDIDIYLSDEVKNSKSLKELFNLYDQFNISKKDLESECINCFKELRLQVEFHRQEIKKRFNISTTKKLDDIASMMIERIKTFENLYLRSINFKFQTSLKSFDEERQKLN